MNLILRTLVKKEKVCSLQLYKNFRRLSTKLLSFLNSMGFLLKITVAQKLGIHQVLRRNRFRSPSTALTQHKPSLSTIRRMFNFSIKHFKAADRYKALVNPIVGTKRNSYREFHPDTHYLFA